MKRRKVRRWGEMRVNHPLLGGWEEPTMSDPKNLDWQKMKDLLNWAVEHAPGAYLAILMLLEILKRRQPVAAAGPKASHCPELHACHEAAIRAQVEALAHLVHACECCEEC
jgi:hypothetical protein